MTESAGDREMKEMRDSMVGLNDRIKQYMERFGWKDIVLNIEKITS